MKNCITSAPPKIMAGTAVTLLALSTAAGADQAAAPAASQTNSAPSLLAWQINKPAWLTEVSLAVKEGYDDNVLLVSGDGPLKQQSSWLTTVSPKVAFNFAPLLGDKSPFQVLSFAYAPDFTTYYSASDENNEAHRFIDTVKGQSGHFTFNLENSVYYIDGSSTAPTYPGNDRYRSGFASLAAKERREQVQDRTKFVCQYDWDSFFIRPTASFLYYDMMTELRNKTGYQNYPSRYDLNGGADLGYRVTKNLAITMGYRYGHQYQQMMSATIDSTQMASDSDYQRVLLGLEGKPLSWLTVALQGGPDFRNYSSTAGVSDRNTITYYGEASATAVITAKDSLSLKYKQWRFVAFCGRVPYFDSNYELAYHRKLTDKLSFDLVGRIAEFDFTCGADPKKTNQRNDFLYSISPGVTYAVTPALSITASGSIDMGRNAQDNPPGGVPYREFNHNLASLSVTYKF